jgi:hypothetical protein
MKECPTCGDNFDTEHGVKCHHTQVHGESLVERDTSTCDNCGEEFEIEPGNANKFCSRDCADEHRTPSGEDHHNYVEYETVECEWCGGEFEAKTGNPNRFCSTECNSAWQSEDFGGEDWHLTGKTGEDHPVYKGYVRHYPREEVWEELREEVFAEYDGECQNCGISRSEMKEEYGYDLDVHHIKKIREFDDPSDAHTVDNLEPLCRVCHRSIEHNNPTGSSKAD